jgi:bis(5'-nucleosyl)-tetraphosphatase (symmetrical)
MTVRHIAIGDIQGCRAELESLLEALRYDPAQDRLEPAGDFVNRGPDSLGVLRLLRTLGAGGVLGNHDLHLLRCAAGLRALRASDTLSELLAADERDELLAWLRAKPFALALPGALLVHAGLHPAWRDPLAELAGIDPLAQDPRSEFCTRVRHCAPDGTRPARDDPAPGAPFRPWFEFYAPDRHAGRSVVFGHWAMLGRVERPGVRGLDTGCVWGGALSAWIAEEDRIVSVPARRAWARARGD